MNGELYANYAHLTGMLDLPLVSDRQWGRTVAKLEEHVTALAKWSCHQVRDEIRKRGDQLQWMATYDGFYLTRGHYLNNSSSSLHDFKTGKVAWFKHRTKRGAGHNCRREHVK